YLPFRPVTTQVAATPLGVRYADSISLTASATAVVSSGCSRSTAPNGPFFNGQRLIDIRSATRSNQRIDRYGMKPRICQDPTHAVGCCKRKEAPRAVGSVAQQ